MKIHVTPAENVQVADPDANDFLPPEGREVERSIYWIRREADGDVTVSTPTAPAKPKTKKDA